MKIGYYVRFECGSEDRMSQDFGPFEDYFQITNGELTAGPDGDISIADFHDGNWYLASIFGDHAKPWSDMIIHAKEYPLEPEMELSDWLMNIAIMKCNEIKKPLKAELIRQDKATPTAIPSQYKFNESHVAAYAAIEAIELAETTKVEALIENHLRTVGTSGITGITRIVHQQYHDLKLAYKLTHKALENLNLNGKVQNEKDLYYYVT